MEQEALYRQYDFDKPWDSQNNLAVTQRRIDIYNCPSSNAADPLRRAP